MGVLGRGGDAVGYNRDGVLGAEAAELVCFRVGYRFVVSAPFLLSILPTFLPCLGL